MEEPFTVEMKCLDSTGAEFVLYRNSLLSYENLLAVQEAVAKALVDLGRAGVEKKAKPQ